MLFTVKWISDIFTNGQGNLKEPINIKEVITDSRVNTSHSLFVPIVGDNFDGHQFLPQAIDNGAVCALWQKDRELPESIPSHFPIFFVEDTLIALQELASTYRDKINPTVIGITGSNGKTTTKDLVASMVSSIYQTHYTKGNFNNHIGLPLTILSMSPNTDVLVLEMGMSDFGEIDLLSQIAKPDYAIITNIGESHIEFLGSREGIAKAKLEILNGLKENGSVIIDGDEELLNELHNQRNTIRCGFGKENGLLIENVKMTSTETTFSLSDGATYSVPLIGKHHAKNAAFAIAVGMKLGIPTEKRKQALLTLKKTSMRFELIRGLNDVSIINDAYNASPTSMKAAIEVIKEMQGFTHRVLVLGDILELGDFAETLHRSIADVVDNSISVLFTYGKNAKFISETAEKKNHSVICRHFTDKQELLKALESYFNKNTIILFKASRGLKFETMIEQILN
ncbi:UDP-N-acetylmuramoyl-tripeptide--D-alanyl-D-alanine ligase [Oceanobacillus senegalensis]|uniref:UDP-N-acetylmuramoyl-tripeptide--D-alanyl-D- alanine ligase n=1 Tax=Oceanobacillus senegalensis TaxID=1936063 RepID=UPI000A30C79C|nr:UDP-N-acetylmuramoyl-tripeptide--D-alanyl-D-alanine ligase [Oceanobacillus senegalensis]